jgi:hypothetical protein
MEAHPDLAILTTNHRSALDQLFLRRLRSVVQFPFPDAEHRPNISQRIFPYASSVQGSNCTLLSKLNVAGETSAMSRSTQLFWRLRRGIIADESLASSRPYGI